MGDKTGLVIDTSSWMNELKAIEPLFYKYKVTMPYVVLEELDNLKDSDNDLKSFKARSAIRFIDANHDKFEFINICSDKDKKNDDLIIDTAKKHDCAIMTNDLGMKVKSRSIDVDVLELDIDNKEYKGYKVVEMTDEEMADFYTSMENKWNILTNEYLLIQDKNKEIVDKYKWNGKKFEIIKYKSINNKFMGKVKPLNVQQELMFDMLQDNDSKIKLVTGKFGTGKDYCMLAHAINQIENGKFDRLVWVRNNIVVANTREIGYLPGDAENKIMPYAQVIADHVGGQFGLEMMIRDGKIELQHIGFIRGRDIKNSIVYVSEAENMTKELVQLIMGRISEDSVLYMNGDFKQVDKDIFRQNSGIRVMIDRLQGHDNFGYINLEKSERSEVARMADILD